jgi:hypothetical protein
MDYISDAENDKNNDYNSHDNKNIKNIGFKFIHDLFISNGWCIRDNQIEHISYSKPGYEADIFDISIHKNEISVCIPIKKSPYLYRTFFKDYYHASEYVEERFYEFIENH